MLFLLPIVLFGLSAAGLTLLRLRGMRMAYMWLLPAFITSICWAAFLILPIPSDAPMFRIPWLFSSNSNGSLVFSFDAISWGFVFLLISLVLGYFLTLPARLEKEKRTVLWIGWLLLPMCAILAFTATNLISLILVWTLIDLMDIVFTYFVLKSAVKEQPLTRVFSSRILSVILLIIAAIISAADGGKLITDALKPFTAMLLIFAAIFRTGLLPYQKITTSDDQSCASFSFLVKTTFVLCGLSLLARLPENFFTGFGGLTLKALFTCLGALFAILTFTRRGIDDQTWVKALICLAVVSALSASPKSALGWAGITVVGAGVIQFYSLRNTRLLILALLSVVAISGLPFTIGMFALNGLIPDGINVWGLLFILIYSFLLLNLVISIRQSREDSQTIETWFQAIYLFGLFLVALSPFVLMIKSILPTLDAFKNWWVGVSVAAITLIALVFVLRNKTSEERLEKFADKFTPPLSILSFRWLGVFWKWIALVVSEIFGFITQLLEGEGGVIWAVVILALLVTLIGVGRL